MGSGDSDGAVPEISLIDVPARHYVGVRRTVQHQELGPLCAEVLPRVAGWLNRQNVQAVGMPITVYHSVDPATGTFDVQPGFFVPGPLADDGEITHGATAAGQAATTVHAGPYETLGTTWDAVFAWVTAQGRTVSQPAWEVYLTDPGAHPDPADWRTEIVVPLD